MIRVHRLVPHILLLVGLGTSALPAQTVRPLSKPVLDSLLQHRHGRPLLLNFWATWCEPCREEFPDLLTAAKEFAGKADIIAVSVDDRDDKESSVVPFLKGQKSTIPAFIADIHPVDSLINAVDRQWTGAIPLTILYDTLGVKRTVLKGQRTLAEFRSAIESLLKKR